MQLPKTYLQNIYKLGQLPDCENDAQMKSYYEIAKSFDTSFPAEKMIPNCQTYKYIPHDYYTDYNYKKMDSLNESVLSIAFLSFYRKVGLSDIFL